MINFFRKKRKKLADDNKVIKYARYAIGEILLVVIGILIALQINNWNEQQKIRTTELVYLENIKTDLQLNIESLNIFITTRSESIKSANIVLDYFENSIPINYNDFNYHSISVMIWFPFEINDNTYQELINSGKLSILSNKNIKDKLQDMNTSLERVKFVENEMQQDFETYLYYPFFTIADLNSNFKNYNQKLIKSQITSTISTNQMDDLLENQKFKNGFVLSTYNSELLIEEYSNMIEITNQLIDLIDKEVK